MGKLGDTFKDGRIVGALFAVGALAVVGTGIGVAATAANAEKPAAVVKTVDEIDFASLPYTNGLAGEQETDAAAAVAVEQARVAAEAAAAEAERVAAEQAAAAEAERVAAEQAAAEEASASEPESDAWAGKTPVPFVVDPNPENAGGGYYDTSRCPSGSGSTGPDGVPYCD